MEFGLNFQEEFLDAYLAGRVTSVGLHSTRDQSREDSLRKGLKCTPCMHKVIRKELGVHWYMVLPKIERINRREAARSFERLCISVGGNDDPGGERPGLVVLKERIERSRFYDTKNGKGEIFNQRYVPVLAGLENAIHTLVFRKDILDVVFLSEEEIAPILKESSRRYGSFAKRSYYEEIGRLCETRAMSLAKKEGNFISVSIGRLLLGKVKKYLIKS